MPSPDSQYQNGNATGVRIINGKRIFFKTLPVADYLAEEKGHASLRPYYPVAALLESVDEKDGRRTLLFEYEDSVGPDRGLLADLFANPDSTEDQFQPVLAMYSEAFGATLARDRGEASSVFFRDRSESRLPTYYGSGQLDRFEGKGLSLNGAPLTLGPGKIIAETRRFFTAEREYWCVLSQCDPNDLNLAAKPVLFDYLAGGMNPLMAEFATLFWYNLAQGSYLAPKYNSAAFADHRAIYRSLDTVTRNGSEVIHRGNPLRKAFVTRYVERVLLPTLTRTSGYKNWQREFLMFLTMKALAVFDVSLMEEKDALLTLSRLQQSWDLPAVESPLSLMEIWT